MKLPVSDSEPNATAKAKSHSRSFRPGPLQVKNHRDVYAALASHREETSGKIYTLVKSAGYTMSFILAAPKG